MIGEGEGLEENIPGSRQGNGNGNEKGKGKQVIQVMDEMKGIIGTSFEGFKVIAKRRSTLIRTIK